METNGYETRIVRMRKEDNSYVITNLQEAISWNLNLDEIVVLCDVLRILDEYNLGVSKNEVRTAFNRHYNKTFHGDKRSYLNWIFRGFKVKDRTRTFTSQVRKNTPLPQTSEGICGVSTTFQGKGEELPINTQQGAGNGDN